MAETDHPTQVAADTACPCGVLCPMCASPAHDCISVGFQYDHSGAPVAHTYLLCNRCGLEFREDIRLVRYADNDAPYRRVHELLTSIEAVALAANHAPVWRGPVVRCERCGVAGSAVDGESYLNGYRAARFPLANPCKRRP